MDPSSFLAGTSAVTSGVSARSQIRLSSSSGSARRCASSRTQIATQPSARLAATPASARDANDRPIAARRYFATSAGASPAEPFTGPEAPASGPAPLGWAPRFTNSMGFRNSIGLRSRSAIGSSDARAFHHQRNPTPAHASASEAARPATAIRFRCRTFFSALAIAARRARSRSRLALCAASESAGFELTGVRALAVEWIVLPIPVRHTRA